VIAQAKYQQEQGQVESDVAFFEGLPFHYLDLNAFIVPGAYQSQGVPSSQLVAESTQSKVADSDATVTSDSSSNMSDAYNMDWNAPLSFPTLQEHMRRSSLQYFGKDCAFADSQQLEDDIDTFFKSFSMPVEMYHEKIEQMSDDDDATFGYLIEQAISQ